MLTSQSKSPSERMIGEKSVKKENVRRQHSKRCSLLIQMRQTQRLGSSWLTLLASTAGKQNRPGGPFSIARSGV